MPPRTALVVWLASAAVLAGCTTVTQPTATPTNSPTYLCTPEAGGTPLPCGPIEAEQAEKRDALYADAEAVYRRFWTENQRLELDPAPSVTAELESLTTGTFRGYLPEMVAAGKGRQKLSGDTQLVRVDRLPGLSREGSEVALLICFDGSQARFNDPAGGEPTPGLRSEQRIYLTRIDGALRISGSEVRSVESC